MGATSFMINGFPATHEQNRIISAILAGVPRVLVNAFAGTGKTTTLVIYKR